MTKAMSNVGILIVQAIERKGFSQNQAADYAEVSRGALSRIINGVDVPRFETLIKLAFTLEIDPLRMAQARIDDLVNESNGDATFQQRVDNIIESSNQKELELLLAEIRAEAESDPSIAWKLRSLFRRR